MSADMWLCRITVRCFRITGTRCWTRHTSGLRVTTLKGLQWLGTSQPHYQYGWKNKDSSLTEKQQNKLADRIGRTLVEYGDVENLVQRGDNQAINFTGDDMGGDRSMFITPLYIIIVVMGFIFGVTTRTTFEREAGAISTLRASGYTRGEMLRHYLALPTIVTLTVRIGGKSSRLHGDKGLYGGPVHTIVIL